MIFLILCSAATRMQAKFRSLTSECIRALRRLEQATGAFPDLQLESGYWERDRGFVF